MSAKVLILCGSPRPDGMTRRVCDWLAQALSDKDAQCELVHLDALRYATGGCTACMGCQRIEEYRCIIEDEASPLLARICEFDALVLATPVYWFGPSAQLKRFCDRMFSLVKFVEGKPVTVLKDLRWALVATAGGGLDDGLRMTRDVVAKMASVSDAELHSLLVSQAESCDHRDVRDRAGALADQLLA